VEPNRSGEPGLVRHGGRALPTFFQGAVQFNKNTATYTCRRSQIKAGLLGSFFWRQECDVGPDYCPSENRKGGDPLNEFWEDRPVCAA